MGEGEAKYRIKGLEAKVAAQQDEIRELRALLTEVCSYGLHDVWIESA